jgi:hypothetical protein
MPKGCSQVAADVELLLFRKVERNPSFQGIRTPGPQTIKGGHMKRKITLLYLLDFGFDVPLRACVG